MTKDEIVRAVKAERRRTLALLRTPDAPAFDTPTALPGWRVRAVVAHLITLDRATVLGANLHVVSGADKGATLYPKIFRRLVTWSVQKKAGVANNTFKQYVASGSDKFRKLADYLASDKNSKKFALETTLGAGGKTTLRPESTVFVEDPNSQLKKDNQVVHKWF